MVFYIILVRICEAATYFLSYEPSLRLLRTLAETQHSWSLSTTRLLNQVFKIRTMLHVKSLSLRLLMLSFIVAQPAEMRYRLDF